MRILFLVLFTFNTSATAIDGDQITLFNDPTCPRTTGLYTWRMAEGVLAVDSDERVISVNRAAAAMLRDRRLDVLDLNFGCPVKKVVKKNGGSALLCNVPLMEEIVRAVVEATACKIRCGRARPTAGASMRPLRAARRAVGLDLGQLLDRALDVLLGLGQLAVADLGHALEVALALGALGLGAHPQDGGGDRVGAQFAGHRKLAGELAADRLARHPEKPVEPALDKGISLLDHGDLFYDRLFNLNSLDDGLRRAATGSDHKRQHDHDQGKG